ncbi:MAG: hypothetical protein MI725_07115 [Pirellulales bacterium]|nr:hypothetical protein [Pirellulales bacterium]
MAPMKCPARRWPKDEFEDSFSLTHLAHRWGVARRDIRHLLQSGELPFVQVLGQLRVPKTIVRKIELAGR